MKEIRRIQSKEKPNSVLKLGNNTYHYNYDIQPCQIEEFDYETNEVKVVDGWSYVPVYIQGQPNYEEIVKHVIREYIDLDAEFDLINTYNKKLINGEILKEGDEYLEYLKLLESIKKEVKEYFKQV